MALIDTEEMMTFCSNKEKIKEYNNVGYITFKNKNLDVITIELKIIDIKDVYSSNNKLIDSFIEYSFKKVTLKRKFLFFKVLKEILVSPIPNYYTGDLYLTYFPKNVLPLDFVKNNYEESIKYYYDNSNKINDSMYIETLSKYY